MRRQTSLDEVLQVLPKGIVHRGPGARNDKCLDDLTADAVRHTNDGDERDRWMLHQAVLDLGRPDPVATGDDDIVVTAVEPEVPFFVTMAGIAGQQPAVAEFILRRVGLIPVTQEEHRVWSLDRDGPGFSGPHRIPFVVHDFQHMTGHRTPHRSLFQSHDRRTVADRQIGFRLPVEFVHRQAESLAAPAQHLFAKSFAAARDRPHGVGEFLLRPSHLTHHLERGRRHECIADTMSAD